MKYLPHLPQPNLSSLPPNCERWIDTSSPEKPPTPPLLREFRQALDNVRMTAWTANELVDARHVRRDPNAVLSFLTAERLRRFSQMVKDLSGDLDANHASVPIHGIQSLAESVRTLQDRLDKLAKKRKKD